MPNGKIAAFWYCDDECDCSYPSICTREPGFRPGIHRTSEVEAGPFHSEPDTAALVEQWDWLLEAAIRHDVDNLDWVRQSYESKHIAQLKASLPPQ